MLFSIITPSFRAAEWLPLALASVADQTGVEVEHLVQDTCSDDGTAEILARHPQVRAFVEKDAGMYDAINRGLRRANGEVLAWLNADEQYLPGTLARVSDYFAHHPAVDVLFGGLVVIDGDGKYLCSRKVLPPLPLHTRVCHLSTFSCAMFFRRRALDDGNFLDPAWKAVGDAEWILRCLAKELVMRSIPDLLSVFTDTGANLGGTTASENERNRLSATAPRWQQSLTPLIAAQHRLRRLLGGVYRQKPFDYAIYTRREPEQRTVFHVSSPTTLWKKRFTLLR